MGEQRAHEYSAKGLEVHRVELAQHREENTRLHSEYSRELSDEVKRLSALMEEQRLARVEYGDRTVVSLEVELHKVNDAIVAEQKLRFEAEGTMLRMVED